MTISKTIAALLGPTLVASAISLLANIGTSKMIVGELSQSPALVMIAGYAAFVPGLAIVYFHNRWTAGWAGTGDPHGLAFACRRPPADGIPHTDRGNSDENRSVSAKLLSCHRDRIPADRGISFVQGLWPGLTAGIYEPRSTQPSCNPRSSKGNKVGLQLSDVLCARDWYCMAETTGSVKG